MSLSYLKAGGLHGRLVCDSNLFTNGIRIMVMIDALVLSVPIHTVSTIEDLQ